MKELSIEEKAKAYDKAIKFAYNKHRFSSNLSEIKLIEEIFPELKEDEREIPISEQKSAEEYNITGIGSKNAQGKLGEMIKRKLEIEKQGEQKPAIKLERDDNGEAVLTPFEAELFSMMSEAWQGYSFGEEVNIAKIVKEHSKELLERANEQKLAWNEEDEKMIKCCEIALEFFEKLGKNTQGFPHENYFELDEKIYPSEVKHWLKFVSIQTKQEWSEEDKGNLLDVKCIIDEVWHNQYVREEIDHSGEELKSLWHWLNNLWERVAYPKNTWKPSDEQIEALEWQIKNTSGDSWQYSKSKELLEQLKKLREE